MNWNELQRPDRLSATPLYDQVEEILRRAIRTGDLAPGQVFPSEPELAALFGVSRLTVRRSLGNLQRTGLIVRRHGVGTFVARVGAAQIIPSSLSFTKNMQMVGLEPTSRVISLTQSPCPASVAPSLGISEGDPVLVLERLRLADSEPVAFEKAWLNGFAVPELDTHAVEGGSLYDYLSVRHGIDVVAIDQTMEPVLLSAAEADLLRSKAGAPAILSEVVGYSQEGTPVEYTRSLTPAGHARFHFHFRQGDVGRRGLRREEDSAAPDIEGARI
ncbi:MAG: GntR family transcriptional regulator [Acidimicrobiia bacterium]